MPHSLRTGFLLLIHSKFSRLFRSFRSDFALSVHKVLFLQFGKHEKLHNFSRECFFRLPVSRQNLRQGRQTHQLSASRQIYKILCEFLFHPVLRASLFLWPDRTYTNEGLPHGLTPDLELLNLSSLFRDMNGHSQH